MLHVKRKIVTGLNSEFLVKGGQEVGGQEVPCEQADAATTLGLHLGPLLLDEALHFGEIGQSVHIRDLDYSQLNPGHDGALNTREEDLPLVVLTTNQTSSRIA